MRRRIAKFFKRLWFLYVERIKGLTYVAKDEVIVEKKLIRSLEKLLNMDIGDLMYDIDTDYVIIESRNLIDEVTDKMRGRSN